MTRLGAVFWLVLVLAAGFTTFKVKYAVQDIEDELSRTRKQTIAEQQETRVLTAEWTYLNQPERLADLNRRFLGLGAITAKQLQRRVEDIPMRAPVAPPAPAADALVAANPAPPDALVAVNPTPIARQVAATPLPLSPVAPGPAPVISTPEREAGVGTPRGDDAADDGARPQAATAPVRLAKAGPTLTANSLDALIAQIAEAR